MAAMDTALMLAANAGKIDGIKISLVDDQKKIAMRRRLPKGVRIDDTRRHGAFHDPLGPTVPLSRHIFRRVHPRLFAGALPWRKANAPRTGLSVAFLASINGKNGTF